MKPWTNAEEAEAIRSWLNGRSATTMAEQRGRTVVDVLTKLGELEQSGRMAATARFKQINPSYYIAKLKQEIAKYCPAVPAPEPKLVPPPDEDICANNHGGNYESMGAFEQVSKKRDIQHAQICSALLDNPDGMVEEEISRHCGMRRNSASARISELKKMQMVIRKPLPFGKPPWHRRQTTSGCFAAVLVINPVMLDLINS